MGGIEREVIFVYLKKTKGGPGHINTVKGGTKTQTPRGWWYVVL